MIKVLSGKEPAAAILDAVKQGNRKMSHSPILDIIQVGNDPASDRYVRNKIKDAEKCGIIAQLHKCGSRSACRALVEHLSESRSSDGIIVQLPLPKGFREDELLNLIPPVKDVDGLSKKSMGFFYSGKPIDQVFAPCTPEGVIRLLDHYEIPIEGRKAVVVGRSTLVGRPLAELLTRRNAAVTILHSKIDYDVIMEAIQTSDIVCLSVGLPHFFAPTSLKPWATVVDIGISFDEDGKLCGDFDPKNLPADSTYAYTPVPGGIGLMTRAVLMEHVARARHDRLENLFL